MTFLAPYTFAESPLWDAISQATARGVRLVVVVFDEQTYSQIWAKAKPHWNVAQVLERLERCGARPIVVPCSSDLEPLFAEARHDRGVSRSRGEPAA